MATAIKSKKRLRFDDETMEETDSLLQTLKTQFTDEVADPFYLWICDTRQQYSVVVNDCINETNPIIRCDKLRELSKKMPVSMQWVLTSKISTIVRFGWQNESFYTRPGIIEKLPSAEVQLEPSHHGLVHLRKNEVPYTIGKEISIWLDEIRMIIDPSLRPVSCLVTFEGDNNLQTSQYFPLRSCGSYYCFESFSEIIRGCQLSKLSSTCAFQLIGICNIPISRAYTFGMISVDIVISRSLLQK